MRIALILLVLFVILLLMKVPIAAAMGISSIVGFLMVGFNMETIGGIAYSAVSGPSVLCIPGYVFAGAIMARGGIADKLVNFLRAWLGHLPGGMALITILGCAFFAAITGSSTATIAAIGALMIPAMINSDYDEGACCVSPDGKTMYFTRCSSDPDFPRNAEIWQSARSDANWAKPSKCEISKDTLSSYAHPAVSPDGQWLYFVSDMPGGIGGYDIWRVRIMDSSKFGGVENLGRPINTPGDEMFPTFRFNGELYFSSDGHPGMGGLDILCAEFDSINGWKVNNLKYPVNSSADDFGMTFEGTHNRGFFASSRNDVKGWDHIYSFEKPEIVQSVKGWVYEKDGYELPEGLVYMVGNDGTNEKISVRGDGSFEKELKPGVDYVFLGTCKGYLNIRQHIKVPASNESHEYVLQFPLPPMNIPVIIDNIFYEFNKATLTAESTEALDRLVGMMTENANITIELSSHCDYRGNDEYNEKLSQRRAESVVNYLIEHGIAEDRLTAKGYGESRPKIVTKKMHEGLSFLNEGDTLTEAYIKKLEEVQQDTCNALNRRTEFRVLRTTYGLNMKELLKEAETEQSQDPSPANKEDEDEELFDVF